MVTLVDKGVHLVNGAPVAAAAKDASARGRTMAYGILRAHSAGDVYKRQGYIPGTIAGHEPCGQIVAEDVYKRQVYVRGYDISRFVCGGAI